MFSPLYSTGGIHVPHPMFMSFQGVPGASHTFPYLPPFHAVPFTPFIPGGYVPRYAPNIITGFLSGETPPQLRKLFIGGLSHDTTDEQLRQYYSQWGSVVDCIVIRDPQTKYSRGFGFVTFATIQMAEAAMSDRPHTINNKIVDPKRAIPREQMSPLFPNHPPPFLENNPEPCCKLLLSGLNWTWHTVDDLRQYFDTFGAVEQVEIIGNPRGFGFVVFEEKAAVDRCLEYGIIHDINGQKCEITRNPVECSFCSQKAFDADEMDGNNEIDFPPISIEKMAEDSQKNENGVKNWTNYTTNEGSDDVSVESPADLVEAFGCQADLKASQVISAKEKISGSDNEEVVFCDSVIETDMGKENTNGPEKHKEINERPKNEKKKSKKVHKI